MTKTRSMTIAVIFAALFLLVGFGCTSEREINPEYRALRTEVFHELRVPYNECVERRRDARYEKRFSECMANDEGKGVSGGCAHIAEIALAKGHDEPDPDAVCDELKSTEEEFLDRLHEEAESRDIQEYL